MDPLTYVWQLTVRPMNSTATLSNPGTAHPTFVADQPGSYEAELVVGDGIANSDPDTVSVVAITRSSAAQQKLGEALNIVANLPLTSVVSKGDRKQLTKTIEAAITKIQAGKIEQARAKISSAIDRCDGCARRGTPDTGGGSHPPAKDFINNCGDQGSVYPLLVAALNLLQ